MKALGSLASPIALATNALTASCARHRPVTASLLPSPSSSFAFCRSVASTSSLLQKQRQLSSSCSRLRSSSARFVTSMAATTEPIEILVKAATGQPDKLGDCPFCQRVMLTLEEKGVPYVAKNVDLSNKPDWFLEINPEGKVPVIKHEGKWVADSDVITQIIEEKYPEPPLKTPDDKASVGSKIFPSFVKFLKSKDPSDGTEQALLAELTAFDEHLKENGPFICGDKITAADLSLAPKLFHMKVALGHYKKWSLPDNLTHVKKYIEAVHSRESFLKTKAAEEHVVAGWQKHLS